VSPVLFADQSFSHLRSDPRSGRDSRHRQLRHGQENAAQLVDYVYRNLGSKATVILSDRLKDIGYSYSTAAAFPSASTT
jgi:hypothetical protein